ncbi:MAG TPA: cytochrome c3 family protein [Steroidobacteraceae bacterium]|nr:cytochrome c3 family protein [Steroidobacteraceae bacterium]
MRFRILRWIRSHAITGRRQYREIVVQTRRLTIGRASDQHLQIADASVFPNHAVIRPGRGREGPLVIEALTPGGVKVNGRSYILRNISQGDEIAIGTAIIAVEPAPNGAPVTLRFRIAETEGSGTRLDRLHVLSLSESGLSKRFWSLMLASGVAAIFLLVPMSAALYQPLRPLLRVSAFVPNDGLWAPGPLHASHQFIGADCNSCHTTPFERVENSQCTACHANVQHHVKVPSADAALFDQQRCGECHIEHSEQATMVSRDQRLCVDCHSKLDTMKPRTRLQNVADFGSAHPEFRLTMLQPRQKSGPDELRGEDPGEVRVKDPGRDPRESQGEPQGQGQRETDWESVRLDVLPNVRPLERSHLLFSHAEHLDIKGIKGPNGDEKLECKDCHVPDASGRTMLPVQMEQHCSRCHSLRFDEKDPSSTVPHGDLQGVYRTLIAHFSQQYLESPALQRKNGRQQARRPGGEAEVISRDEQRRARDWAEQQSMAAARDLFEKRVCVDCHEVSKLPDRAGFQQWRVEPVRLTRSWMPQAQFDHASHRTSLCTACHVEAEKSEKSSDVLMPRIAECRTCHSGADDRDKLPSDCLMCHQFHLPNRGLFDQQTVNAAPNGVTPMIRRRSALRTGAGR